jgi:hypothetical protein
MQFKSDICRQSGLILMAGLLLACSPKQGNPETATTMKPDSGTFAYDLQFLNQHKETLVLEDSTGNARIAIIPGWQARVMTSTANGDAGFSYGWINYNLIRSGKPAPHFNAFGGEERLWLGPEGGQFSIYFAKGVKQEFNNWFVPAALDTLPFTLLEKTSTAARFSSTFTLVNYSGTRLDIGIERNISLLSPAETETFLDMKIPGSVRSVAYQSENSLRNNGNAAWTDKTGKLSVWMLAMFTSSPGVTIFVPYKQGSEKELGKVLNDDYFGKVPAERLIADAGMIYLKADGKYRSKIGIPPQRALPFSGSYDSVHHALTILWCELHPGITEYVNSKWEIQQDPFAGDAINAYNDGPVADGTQMGPFYELESSSPAAGLKPGETMVHRQRIFHFEGSEADLSRITEKVFGVELEEVKKKF